MGNKQANSAAAGTGDKAPAVVKDRSPTVDTIATDESSRLKSVTITSDDTEDPGSPLTL